MKNNENIVLEYHKFKCAHVRFNYLHASNVIMRAGGYLVITDGTEYDEVEF